MQFAEKKRLELGVNEKALKSVPEDLIKYVLSFRGLSHPSLPRLPSTATADDSFPRRRPSGTYQPPLPTNSHRPPPSSVDCSRKTFSAH